MHETERALLAAVATRRAERGTHSDVRTERALALFAVAMTAFAVYGTLRIIFALV